MIVNSHNPDTGILTFRTLNSNEYLDYLRKQPINTVLLEIYSHKSSLEFNSRGLTEAQKGNPSEWDRQNNAHLQSLLDGGCQVLAEKFQDPKEKIIPLSYFTNTKAHGYFKNKEINDKIAANITITKNDLCHHWPTTLEIIKNHRSLFNFPSKLSLLKFPLHIMSKKKFIILLMPPHIITKKKKVPMAKTGSEQMTLQYKTPEKNNASVYNLPLQDGQNPVLTIKDNDRIFTLDISPGDYGIRCENNETLENIFESNKWLSSINPEKENDHDKKLMTELNNQLTLEEKLRLIDACGQMNTIKSQDAIIENQDTIIENLDAIIKEQNERIEKQKTSIASIRYLAIGSIILSIVCLAIQQYLMNYASN